MNVKPTAPGGGGAAATTAAAAAASSVAARNMVASEEYKLVLKKVIEMRAGGLDANEHHLFSTQKLLRTKKIR
jgi:hypothetical protein